jgi:hypothetical protein
MVSILYKNTQYISYTFSPFFVFTATVTRFFFLKRTVARFHLAMLPPCNDVDRGPEPHVKPGQKTRVGVQLAGTDDNLFPIVQHIGSFNSWATESCHAAGLGSGFASTGPSE